MSNKRGFTLLELLIVVVIVVILASIAFPSYRKTILTVQDKEAKVMLEMIKEGQKNYYLSSYSYQNCANAASCNSLLHLSVSDGTWSYKVANANASTYCVQASNATAGRYWSLRKSQVDATSGQCP